MTQPARQAPESEALTEAEIRWLLDLGVALEQAPTLALDNPDLARADAVVLASLATVPMLQPLRGTLERARARALAVRGR